MYTTAHSLSSRQVPRPQVRSASDPMTFGDIDPPAHEPEAEPKPTRLETAVLDAYLQELIGCEGVQRIDQWAWVVQGWDKQGCILKASRPATTMHGEH